MRGRLDARLQIEKAIQQIEKGGVFVKRQHRAERALHRNLRALDGQKIKHQTPARQLARKRAPRDEAQKRKGRHNHETLHAQVGQHPAPRDGQSAFGEPRAHGVKALPEQRRHVEQAHFFGEAFQSQNEVQILRAPLDWRAGLRPLERN